MFEVVYKNFQSHEEAARFALKVSGTVRTYCTKDGFGEWVHEVAYRKYRKDKQ